MNAYNRVLRIMRDRDEGARADLNSDNHDKHYADARVQPGELRAELAVQLSEIPRERLVFVLDAVKHIVRAGNKKGEPWQKDIEKAINELTRAVTGAWRRTSV